MKKLTLIIMVLVLLSLVGCDWLDINYENEEDEPYIITIYEYSYETPKNELIKRVDSPKGTIEYYSLGPYLSENQKEINNGKSYPLIRHNDLSYEVIIDGYDSVYIHGSSLEADFCFINIKEDIDIKSFEKTNHILVAEDSSAKDKYVFLWLYRKTIANAHFFINLRDGIYRATLNYNEKTDIEEKPSGLMRHSGDYLYYIAKDDYEEFRGGNLYRVKLDGTQKEILTDENCLDYCVTDNDIIYLSDVDGTVSVIYEEIIDNDKLNDVSRGEYHKYIAYIETGRINKGGKLYEFKKISSRIYTIAGKIGDKIYICDITTRTRPSELLKIYELCDGKLELVHEARIKLDSFYVPDLSSYFIPFVKDDCIYYVTSQGMQEYNTITDKCRLIAYVYRSDNLISY